MCSSSPYLRTSAHRVSGCDQDEPQCPWSTRRYRRTLSDRTRDRRQLSQGRAHHYRKGIAINVLLVDLPDLLRDVVRHHVTQLPNVRVGEVDFATLRLLAGRSRETTAVVWAGSHDAPRWEPGRRLLAPCRGLRVLRVDEPGESAVLFEMRPTAEILPDVGLDALLEVASRHE